MMYQPTRQAEQAYSDNSQVEENEHQATAKNAVPSQSQGQPNALRNDASLLLRNDTPKPALLTSTADAFAWEKPSTSNDTSSLRRDARGDHSTQNWSKTAKHSIRPDFTDDVKPLRYEFCFEVACSEQALINNVGCSFSLGKTIREPELGHWHKAQSSFGTKFTIHTAYNEPKRLMIQVGSTPMGLTINHSVKLEDIGSDSIRDSFVPVIPAVQHGDYLGLPTKGYYYHICNRRLIQEYKILGDNKWSFYATRSTHEALDERRGYNRYQNAILLFWKLRGHLVRQQHLVYLEQQITREQLDNLSDEWLQQHSVAIDIPTLLKSHQSTYERPRMTTSGEVANVGQLSYFVQNQLGTNQRESWHDIAKKHGMSPKALLDLNPKYQANPGSLNVGDEILIADATAKAMAGYEAYSLPKLPPQRYNRAKNVRYRYPSSLIEGTHLRAINNSSVIDSELPIVNVRQLHSNRYLYA
ncbi:MIX and LysM peptidoglycan-binding domain-containing protein [Vibrio palustris]|uniref:LysM domain-containing protein n=1 Tax=Vibrio palustris TaxID=1918946 RepID=A0A1R4B100_9VIBR|nr:LysM peptidoglycan-binding domain-containing protein [Vibrio palustris]SJL82595.1 hypothetical protein VPAL9027_00525 [Vibrio palustris]